MISIITLAHNGLNNIRTLFEHMQHYTYGLGIDKEWLIVNNNANDDIINYLNDIKKYPGIRIINNKENLSFSIANNQAVKEVNGEWICFLNSDTIPQKGWLDEMSSCAERNNADMVGARMYFPHTETIQHVGIIQREDNIFTHRFYNEEAKDHPEIMKDNEMPVTAACMLISKSIFNEVDGFDEGFLWGLEDVDLNLKLMLNNKKIMYCAKAFLYHVEHGDNQNINKDFAHNLKLLNKKWGFYKEWQKKN